MFFNSIRVMSACLNENRWDPGCPTFWKGTEPRKTSKSRRGPDAFWKLKNIWTSIEVVKIIYALYFYSNTLYLFK